ncbi:hypothetical protein BH23PLA1_BH23PLA1_16830 [soil metagenome]
MRLDKTQIDRPRAAPHRRYVPFTSPAPRTRSIALPESRPGLYVGEPEHCRRDARQFVPVLVQFALLLAIFHVYRVEGRAFQLLVTIALAALPVHYLLPYRFKKWFFVGISIVGLAWVFGGPATLIVLPMAATLITIAMAPLPWRVRAGAIALIAVGLALARAGAVDLGIPSLAWPVIGTMFMFRMIIYLYEQKHAKKPESLVDTLSYFFLLPNYCFLHFPVVDYRTFLRGYFAEDIHKIQRDGLRMMLRGAVHLLLYRLVYHELLITPGEVQGPGTLAQFLVCNYLLYLRVSGQFHMACGMLHLFGFKLPETHHFYLLATGFTDYWRRINIYWKDFMVRVIFNPVVFRLKRRPQAQALAAATVVVFFATWFLHAYQKFWLQGSWGFSTPDALFWGILGGFVLINVQLDARNPSRHGRSRSPESSTRARMIRILKVAGTFTTIALLWSLWSSPSVSAWLEMLKRGVTGG